MSEEKKAIETVENFIKYYKDNEQTGNRANLDVLGEEVMAIEFILNKYDVQENEINNLKEIEKSHQTDNGLLRQELDMQIEHNKELEAKRIWNKRRIEEHKKELVQEKENNKELEEHQRQYLDGELITAKQGKFFEKMIKENYIRKDKIKKLIDEELPGEEICKSCYFYDVNGVSLKEKLEKILEV